MNRCHTGDDCLNPGWVSTGPPFCPWCTDAARDDILALPLDYLDLAQVMVKAGGVSIDEATSRPKPASSPPINLAVDALMRRIVWNIAAWEFRVLFALGRTEEASSCVRPGFLTARGASLLASSAFGTLVRLPQDWMLLGMGEGEEPRSLDGIDAVNLLRGLHHTARDFLGLTEKKIRLPGDCPGCGALTLTRLDGGERVACELCKRSWDYFEYQRYVSLMTGEFGLAKRSRN